MTIAPLRFFLLLFAGLTACVSSSHLKLVEKSKQTSPIWLQSQETLANEPEPGEALDMIYASSSACDSLTLCIVATRQAGAEAAAALLREKLVAPFQKNMSKRDIDLIHLAMRDRSLQIAQKANKDMYFEGYSNPEHPTQKTVYKVYIWYELSEKDWRNDCLNLVESMKKSPSALVRSFAQSLGQYVL